MNIFTTPTILPQVKVKSSLLTIKIKQSANVWKKVSELLFGDSEDIPVPR